MIALRKTQKQSHRTMSHHHHVSQAPLEQQPQLLRRIPTTTTATTTTTTRLETKKFNLLTRLTAQEELNR